MNAASPSRPGLLRTLRKLHAWVGLAGASFGLLFGLTGFFLNHRAVMKVPGPRVDVEKAQVVLATKPASPEELARILGQQLGLPLARARWQTQAGRPVRLAGAPAQAAEGWTVTFNEHKRSVRATYTTGNATADVEARNPNWLGILQRLHKADAGSGPWILLVDAWAGALVFLSLSGILLWTRLDGTRLLAAGLALGGLAAMVGVAALAW